MLLGISHLEKRFIGDCFEEKTIFTKLKGFFVCYKTANQEGFFVVYQL